MQSTLSVGCFIRIICAEIKNFKDPDPCCVPSLFAPAYIFHLYLRMGCTWSSIKAQVKSKVLNASIACLPLRLLRCTKWNESFHLDRLTVTRQTNSKPILFEYNLPIWENKHHNALFVFVIVSASLTGWPVVFGSTVCLDGAGCAKSGGIDRHVLWVLPVPVNRMLETFILRALIEINSMLLATEE